MARPPRSEGIDRLAIVDEAVESLGQRRLRTALTCLGTVLGVGVLVSVLGLTSTAASQIDSHFTELTATAISVAQRSDGTRTQGLAFPADFETRVARINGTTVAGLAWTVTPDVATVQVAALPQARARVPDTNVVAVTPAALRVARTRLRTGKLFDNYAQQSKAPVAVIGPTVARELGISSVNEGRALTIGDTPFTIVGILESAKRHPELLNSIIIPAATAVELWGDPAADAKPTAWIEVRRGAGEVVAKQVANAISAANPEQFEVLAPPSPRRLRGTVGSDIQALFVVLAGICLVVGMVGIANTTFVTVVERTGEIGLRRALGARKVHIATQFLTEAGVIGLLGGLFGTFLGMASVLAVALAKGWTAVIPTGLALAGPGIGLITALLAALYPAIRGARIEPITALRGTN